MVEWKEIELREICSDISYGYTASANDTAIGPNAGVSWEDRLNSWLRLINQYRCGRIVI